MNQPSLWERLAERQQTSARQAPEKNDDAQVAQDFASTGLIGRRYKLAGRIGRGRFGPIYAATDEGRRELGIEGRVAVQLIDERFVRDPRVAAELTSVYDMLSASAHPNIVRTLEFARDSRALFLVTELLEGLSLDAVLDEVAPEPLAFDEAAAALTAVGDALRYLHAKGYVYGQLRPKNVFVTFEYGIKLLDVAPVSPPVGMPYYVEDVGKQPSMRHSCDDVFELACLAYELLSGRHPFNENSPVEAQRVGLEPLPLPNLDEQRWQAIARALALERAARTPTVQRFLDELAVSGTERIRTAQTSLRTPPPPRYPPQRARTWQASQEPNGELRAFETMPLQPRQRRPLSVATLARSFFGIAVVVTLGGFAMLYYGELRESAADLLALVEQKRSPQRPATAAANSADAPETVASTSNAPASTSAPPSSAASPEPAPRQAATPPPSGAPGSANTQPRSADPTAPASPSVDRSTPPASSASTPPTAIRPPSATATDRSPATGSAPNASRGSSPGAQTAPLATPPTSAGDPSGTRGNEASTAAPRTRVAEAPSERPISAGLAKPAQPPTAEFPFAFAAPTMSVSEKDKIVRVQVLRVGPTDTSASVVWWVGNATATEDNDYGKLGQHTERFEPGEESRMLYIPLIDDKVREPTESLNVYLGRYSPQRQHLDAHASLRVDIVDDD